MKKSRKDPVREDRIHNEAIVDASPDEQAMSWYHYLEKKFVSRSRQRAGLHRSSRLSGKVKPLRSCTWRRTTCVSMTCSSWSDGRVAKWPSRSPNSLLSIQTNQPVKLSVTGITGSYRVTVSDLRTPTESSLLYYQVICCHRLSLMYFEVGEAGFTVEHRNCTL